YTGAASGRVAWVDFWVSQDDGTPDSCAVRWSGPTTAECRPSFVCMTAVHSADVITSFARSAQESGVPSSCATHTMKTMATRRLSHAWVCRVQPTHGTRRHSPPAEKEKVAQSSRRAHAQTK